MNKILTIILLCLLLPLSVQAADKGGGACDTCADTNWSSCTAADAEEATLAVCVTNANTGATINVPADTATWAGNVNCPDSEHKAGVCLTRPMSIIGAGIGSTVITRSSGAFMVGIVPASYTNTTNVYRVSGFTFDLNDQAAAQAAVVIGERYKTWTEAATALPKARVDHNRFTNSNAFNSQAVINRGTMSGVVDNNQFDDILYPIRNDTDSMGGETQSQSILAYVFPYWSNGSNYPIYYEDNTFSGMYDGGSASIVMDCQWGTAYVARYNTITLGYKGQPIFDAHGYGATDAVSCFGTELYGNRILAASAVDSNLASLRSGSNFVYANDHAAVSGTPDGTYYYAEVCPPDNFGQLIHDSYTFINRTNTTGTLLGAHTTRDVNYYIPGPCNGLTDIATEGRDFFDDGSTPGVSCGTDAPPGSCTVGQGYWRAVAGQSGICSSLSGYTGDINTYPTRDTISGTFYKCTATDTWTAFYTPYTYPHPLRGSTPAGTRFVPWRIP